jgi:hypothetical protein
LHSKGGFAGAAISINAMKPRRQRVRYGVIETRQARYRAAQSATVARIVSGVGIGAHFAQRVAKAH